LVHYHNSLLVLEDIQLPPPVRFTILSGIHSSSFAHLLKFISGLLSLGALLKGSRVEKRLWFKYIALHATILYNSANDSMVTALHISYTHQSTGSPI